MSYNNYFAEINPDLSLDEKITMIKGNVETASRLRSEIRALSTPAAVCLNKTELQTLSNPNTNKVEKEGSKLKALCDQISLLDISNLTEEEIISKLRAILGNDINIITIEKIKLMLYKELIIYNKMILTTEDKIELKELQESIETIRTIITLLDEIELEEEEEVSEIVTENNNNIFFLLSDTGKIIALESLRKNIPKEYYTVIKQMINNLKTGKARDIKKLVDIEFFELRVKNHGAGIRLLFDKLSNGNYIIIDCFMKKVEGVGLSIRNTLDNRNNQYKNKKEYYLNRINNPDFIKEHEGYLAEVLSLLDSKELEGDELNNGRTI